MMKELVLVCAVIVGAHCLLSGDAETATVCRENGSGPCGDNMTWMFSTDTLTISGFGLMNDYGDPTPAVPWKNYANVIKHIVINDGVESIGDFAFYDLSQVESVTIPESVRSIGERSFAGCYSLEFLDIPEGVTSIGPSAFSNCDSLESIVIPSTVKSIGNVAFEECSALINVTIKEGVELIEGGAFMECSDLKSVIIPSSVKEIRASTFLDCCNLVSVTIPYGVTSIKPSTFKGCTKLETLSVPDSVKSIERSAFEDCSRLKSVNIPEGVSTIGESAFNGCNRLTSIVIPSSVSSIEDSAFSGCSNLESVSYLGLSDPGPNSSQIFPQNISFICVPESYNSDTFCGANVSCKSEHCGVCYSFTVDGSCSASETNSAIEWEKQSNECIEYLCDNLKGNIKRSRCECIDGRCITQEDTENKTHAIEMDVEDLNSTNITSIDIAIELSDLTGIDLDDIIISVEYNDDGIITKIIVYVNDESTADTLRNAVLEKCIRHESYSSPL